MEAAISTEANAPRDFSEFRTHWRAFLACFIGIGSALSLNPFVLGTFAPYFLKEFGWSKADWALAGSVTIVVLIGIPLAGRMADRFGVRAVATLGIVTYPLSLVLMSQFHGSFAQFVALFFVQTLLGSCTTATVYTRLVAQNFVKRRGLALALCAMSPAIIGAVGAPLITSFVHAFDWRSGLLAVATFSALCGLVNFLLLPSGSNEQKSAGGTAQGIYRALAKRPIYWMLFLATFLVSLPHALVNTQLKMVLLEQGISDSQSALLVSIFAAGVILGRLSSGILLDYFAPHSVAAIFLGLPAIGLMLLASGLDAFPVLALSIMLVGLANGGEGDVIAFLVVRIFGIGVYSTVLGLLTAAMGAASSLGSGALGLLIEATGSFDAYLIGSAIAVLFGSVLFQMVGKHIPKERLAQTEAI